MNCDNDFYIPYDRTYIKVKPFCESTVVHYKVYLPQGEMKVQPYFDEQGTRHWHEFQKGESQLAQEIGKLIDEQQTDTIPATFTDE